MTARRTWSLTPYQGKLSPAQAAEGINMSIRNARRLALDAGLMLDLQSFATAASLAVLAIEEIGKVCILPLLACAQTDADADLYRKFEVDHGEIFAHVH
jgi:AbiV family abortive infection protein